MGEKFDDDFIKQLTAAVYSKDKDMQREMLKDKNPFDVRDAYGQVLNDIVLKNFDVGPKFTSNSNSSKIANELAKKYTSGADLSEHEMDLLNRLNNEESFGHNWAGLKSMFEQPRIPLTNNLRYSNPDGDTILRRYGARALYDSQSGNIYTKRPELLDHDNWNVSDVLHEIAHDKHFKEGFDAVPYGYYSNKIDNPTMNFGGMIVDRPSYMHQSEGGSKFMNDLFIHDRDLYNKLNNNELGVAGEVASGSPKLEKIFDAMAIRAKMSKGLDMAENYWEGHHKYGMFERDAAERLSEGKSLRNVLLPLAVGTAAWSAGNKAYAGDLEGAGKDAAHSAMGFIPGIGDSLEPLGQHSDDPAYYRADIASKVSDEQDKLIQFMKEQEMQKAMNQ